MSKTASEETTMTVARYIELETRFDRLDAEVGAIARRLFEDRER